MSSSFITKDRIHGFWINDSLMQVACWGLVNVIDQRSTRENWMDEFRDHLYNNSQGVFVGFMHLRLGDFLINDHRKQAVVDLVKETEKFFLKKGEYLDKDELNAFQIVTETKALWLSSLETKRMIKILDCLIDLVQDNVYTKAGDEINYDF